MNQKEQEERRALYARMEDLAERAQRGEMACTPFLSPKDCYLAGCYLRQSGRRFLAFGGYEDAERKRLYLLPDYMEEREEALVPLYLAEYGHSAEITVLRVEGSGYRVLTHRDFLGSLLGLQIDRGVLGDLVVDSEEGQWALIFCETAIAPFLEQELTQVANDKVKVRRVTDWQIPPRCFASIHDTVASARLDCVVASLCGLSRSRAAETVSAGLVEIDFESEDRPDRTVGEGAWLSIRGYGRFRILRLNDRTKKGRLRLEAEKCL